MSGSWNPRELLFVATPAEDGRRDESLRSAAVRDLGYGSMRQTTCNHPETSSTVDRNVSPDKVRSSSYNAGQLLVKVYRINVLFAHVM